MIGTNFTEAHEFVHYSPDQYMWKIFVAVHGLSRMLLVVKYPSGFSCHSNYLPSSLCRGCINQSGAVWVYYYSGDNCCQVVNIVITWVLQEISDLRNSF